MISKFSKYILFSVYPLVLAVMAAATIVEKYRGTEFVSEKIYGAWWFVLLWALLAAVGAACIVRRQIRRKSIVLLHVAMIVVLIGAALTHFTRWQGFVSMRQGTETNRMVVTSGRGEGYEHRLPFSIRLNSFRIARHAGTEAAADYIANVSIAQGKAKAETYEISMNNPLQTGGLTVMLSSYDTQREGCTMAVNSDSWGTPVTYVGYALLFLAVIWMLVEPRSTFRRLLASPLLKQSAFVAMLMASVSLPAGAADAPPTLPRDMAKHMGQLLIRYNDRICPMQTYAIDFTRKVYGKSSFKGLSAEQVLTGWLFWPDQWSNEPFIKTGSNLQQTLMIDSHMPLNRFFNPEMGGYILGPYIREYYGGQQDKFHREVAAVDERLQLLMDLRRGASLCIFPMKAKDGVIWLSCTDEMPAGTAKGYRVFAQNVLELMRTDAQSGDWPALKDMFTKIQRLQQREGKASLPSATKVKAETIYNAVPFNSILFMLNLTVGFVLLLIFLVRIGRGKENDSASGNSVNLSARNRILHAVPVVVMVLSWAFLTFFCVLRWIVSGTVPMANGFETMLFVAWIVMALSLICVRRMPVVLTFGFIMSGFFLLVSHISQMDPQITHVMPVLNSPLLSIHVSVIMFAFALLSITFICAVMALLSAWRMRVAARKAGAAADADARRTRMLESFSAISHLFLYPAITTLTLGIFIGAIWAARSWGMYWSWDPKETWALITLMVYAIPLHTGIVSGLRRPVAYHIFMALAFLVIIMTYFGVNYFLSGMHSYA